MHIPSFEMPSIRYVWQLIQCDGFDLKNAYLHIPIVKFFTICLANYHIRDKLYPSGWPESLGFSQPSLNLSCSFTDAKVSVTLSI